MPTPIMFVCVNRRFSEGMPPEQLKEVASGNWDITVAKATTCQRVVAMHFKAPIGAWVLKGAYKSTEKPKSPGHLRTGLVLGDALPVLDGYWSYPSLRHGVAVGLAAEEPTVLASEPQSVQLGVYGCAAPSQPEVGPLLHGTGDALPEVPQWLASGAASSGRRIPARRRVMITTDLSASSESDLFASYAAILGELKSRGVIRTMNAPAGDYAEYLVATALGGKLAPSSEKSWDVLANNGEKLQVKCRVVSDPAMPGQLQLGIFRSFSFDYAVIVLLSATDYTVKRAAKIPRCVVESCIGPYRQHVNGKVLFATPEVMGHPDATDLTAILRAAQTA